MDVKQNRYTIWQNQLTRNYPLRVFWEFWTYWAVLYYPLIGIYLSFSIKGQRDFIVFYFVFATAFLFANFVIPHLISYLFHRPRPFVVNKFTPVGWFRLFSNLHNTENSMPSEHSSSSVALSLVLLFYWPGVGLLGLVIAMWIGLARVISGYHYPSDVIIGYAVGATAALIALTFPFI